MQLIPLDRRYSYHNHFKYCIEFKGVGNVKQFIDIRSYLIENWGQSIEANLYTNRLLYRSGVNYLNIPWSWSQLDDYHYRLYIVDGVAAAQFKLAGLLS